MKKEPDLDSFYDNEAEANKQICSVNAASAFMALVMWGLYLIGVFSVPDSLFPVICVVFPVAAFVLIIPLFFIKTDKIRQPWFKYFMLFTFLAVIMAINITIPNHAVLLWPFTIIIANHYYNPKVGKIIFAFTIVAMFICLYLSMFFGEYDSNLLGSGVIKDGSIVTVDSFAERKEMLRAMRERGNNRYVKAFVFYFFPRAYMITLFSMVSNLLNKRTYTLYGEKMKEQVENERNKTELEVAKGIQLDTLPAEVLKSDEAVVIGELKAAKEVGGDLFDYLNIDENHIAFLIGDVSGKGIPAAMFMMKTMTSFRDFAKAGKSPSEILREINGSILKGNKACMFVTAFLGILDKRDGTLVFSNAGHNPPVIGSGTDYRYLKCNSGFALGCFEKTVVIDENIILKPGESITVYTDGITEARNGEGDFFGEDRLINVFNQKEHSDIETLHRIIKEEIAEFVQDAPQSDDIAVLTVEYK